MGKNTRKASFGKWIAPINTKKLTTEAYIKIMLLAQLQDYESLEAMSDALIDGGLQKP